MADNLLDQSNNPDGQVPSYLMGADNHNIGNSMGGSWLDPDTWATKFSNAGKFIATSVLSGADSFYNTAATVGSWAGVSSGPHDTGEWISSLDDDLGKYYSQNRQAVDLAGFIAGSFIPGLGGIKILNAGQRALKAASATGIIGENLARATGLLVPESQMYVKLAAKDIAASSGAVSLMNQNTVKALASGVYQNVLEGAAFETAVQATMAKSPILDDQDGWDIAKNIAMGGVLGGAVGGAIEGARSLFGIKKLVQGETVAAKPFSSRFISADAAPADQKIILTAEARDSRAMPLNLQGDAYPLGDSNATANQKLYASSVEKDNNAIRANINSLVKGSDGTIGNVVADALHNAPAQQMMETMLHANEIGTIGTTTANESIVAKAIKSLDLGAIGDTSNMSTRFVKLVGEDAGNVVDSTPTIPSIADTVKTSAKLPMEQAVMNVVKDYGFSTKTPWDATQLSGTGAHTEAEARYIWARNSVQEIKPDTVIHENDIPLLERAYTDLKAGKPVKFKLQYADGSISSSTISGLERFSDGGFIKTIKSGGRDVGELRGTESAKAFQVTGADLDPSLQGKGLASSSYAELANHAASLGKSLVSDNSVTPAAARVYESLEAKGFKVVKDPTAKLVTFGKSTKYETANRNPVFTVTGTVATKEAGEVGGGLSVKDLGNLIATNKEAIANDLLEKMVFKGKMPVEQGTEGIAKIVNVKKSYLEGTRSPDVESDLFAKQAADKDYQASLVSKGLRSASEDAADTDFIPKYAKIAYKVPDSLKDLNGNVADGMVWLKQQQKLYQESADRVFAKNAGTDITNAAVPISDKVLLNANLNDGGAGLASFANGNYGTLGSYAQQIGANVTRPLKQLYRTATNDAFEGPLVALGSNQKAAIEFDVLNNKVASTMEQYVLDTDGHTGEEYALISKKVRDYNRAIQNGEKNVPAPQLQNGAPEYFPIENPETYNTIAAHIQREGDRVKTLKEINAALGKEDNKQTEIFRPIRPNPNDYPFFAFVKDDKVTGAGHTTMIHAASEQELRKLVDAVPTDQGYSVIYKNQAEDYYKARGEYEYSRTLNENYIDSDLKSRGINSQFFTKTDPQKITDDILNYHLRQDDVTAAELVRMKYQPQFDWLEDQGKQFTTVGASRYGSALSNVEKYGKNPYTDYIKTALDVSKASEYPLLYSANRAIDNAVSNVWGKVSSVFQSAKSPAQLDSINNILDQYGINSAYNSAATDALVNHTAPKAVLSKFIRTSNALLAKFTLALDPLNGINHTVGANVLRATELKSITDAIQGGNTELAGQLADIGKIALPGLEDQGPIALSPTKMIAKSIQNFFQDDGTRLAQYKSEGLIGNQLAQFKSILDDFSLKGTETAGELDKRTQSAFQKAKAMGSNFVDQGEKWTGNAFFHDFNRFISADVMRQLTDLGEQHGLMTPAESQAYRNTFVNRVEGNTVASQRPVMFQGPIGQALGLFQSYQFNLMQQMFRYIGEGSGKDAAMMMGLQGTMYGINGLPAFQAINNHIIGNLSGNTNHTDLYDAAYGIAGKTAGDFLMYGIPSNIMQTAMYTRGHMNPRSLTLIPNQISDIPIVASYGKLFSSLYNTASKISNGGNVWESILQGIEHNGISRPLAGLAQDLQSTTGNGVVFSTSQNGTIIGSNDLMSLASLSRLAGARPLDEAIVSDGLYRISAYEAAQKDMRDKLEAAAKTTTIEGQTPDENSISKFAAQYAASGGKQAQFNSFMINNMKSANTSQSQRIMQQLQSPFAQKMQVLMGGRTGVESNGQQTMTQNTQ